MNDAPDALDQTFNEAVSLHQTGALDRAAALYRQILATRPEHAGSLHLLGLVAHQSGRHEEAAELIGKAVEISEPAPVLHSNLAVVLRALDRPKEAEAHFRRAIALDPSYVEAQANLASLLQSAGRLDDAVVHYRQALALNPRHAAALSNFGGALCLLGRHEEARATLDQAIAVAPDHVDAHFNLGILLSGQGRVAPAIASFQRVLELRPTHGEACRWLADRLAESGRLEAAQASYGRALELMPDNAPALIGLATVLLERGERDKASEIALRAADRAPVASVALGTVLARCGHVTAARAQLEACLAGPEAEGAALALASLGLRAAPERPSDAQVRQFYSALAEGWDEKMSLSDQYFAPGLVAGALDRLLGGEGDLDILDAACGTGLAGALLRGRARRLEGVDLSPDMLAKAQAKSLYDFLAEDDIARFLHDRPLRYDIVTCVAALFFMRDLRPVFAAVAGALRQGGLFVLTLFPNDREGEAEEVRLQLNGTYQHGRSYLVRAAEEAGFAVALMEDHVHEMLRGAPAMGLLLALRKL